MVIAYAFASLVGGAVTVACLWPLVGPWGLLAAPFGGSGLVMLAGLWLIYGPRLPLRAVRAW